MQELAYCYPFYIFSNEELFEIAIKNKRNNLMTKIYQSANFSSEIRGSKNTG